MSEHTFVGPYVSCTQRKEKEDVKVRRCGNAKCSNRKNTIDDASIQFCAKCGTKIKPVTEKQPRHVSHYDVLEADVLTVVTNEDTNPFFLIPNRAGPREFNVELDEHQDLTDINIAAEIAWFKELYEKEIMALEKAFDNVVVRWGVHRNYL